MWDGLLSTYQEIKSSPKHFLQWDLHNTEHSAWCDICLMYKKMCFYYTLFYIDVIKHKRTTSSLIYTIELHKLMLKRAFKRQQQFFLNEHSSICAIEDCKTHLYQSTSLISSCNAVLFVRNFLTVPGFISYNSATSDNW